MILNVVQLTASGRPVLQPGEVEVLMLDKVDLEFHPIGGLEGQQAAAYKGGYAILTNRRLIWVDASSSGRAARAASLPLAAVAAASKKTQLGLKGSKVRLMVEAYTNRQMQPVPVSGFHSNLELLGLRCRGPPPDAFLNHLHEQVRQAVAADAATAAGAAAGGSAGGAGTPPRPTGAGAAPPTHLPDSYMSPLRAGLQARGAPGGSDGSGGGGGGGGGTSAAAAAAGASPGLPRSTVGGGAQAPGAAQAVSPPEAAASRPDQELLQQMVDMGFPRNRSARALMATRNQGVQEAIDFLLAFGEQPGMDDPWDTPSPAAASTTPWSSPPPPAANPAYPAIFPAAAANPYPYSPAPNDMWHNPLTAAAGGGSGPPGSPLYGGGTTAAAASAATLLQAGMQQTSLHPHPHPYNSAPDLRAAEAGGAGPGRAIGVAGIVKREQAKTAESGRAVEEAFRDLSALMTSAATMVALAEKFRGVLGADGAGGGGSGGGEDPLLLDLETTQQLIALGISSPVTRGTAGARYHIELSRQLADFLELPLQRVGGLMSLPDVYCLFNRARGTELVSPDDLLQAAKSFSRAGVTALKLRPLSSGVLVIQGPQHSEERVCAKIAELTKPAPQQALGSPTQTPQGPPPPPALGPGLTAGDVALALGGISTAIAAEHLLMAEARGVVCRDDGPEGLRFYRNFFKQDGLGAKAA